jgi:hypothetical protein
LKVKSGVIAGGFAALALAVVSAAAADSQGTTSVKARLTAGQVVPRGTVKRTKASGLFSGTLTKTKKGYRLTWRLTFSKLSGRATSGYIHRGMPGKHGAALFHLCSPCSSGAHGSAYASPSEVALISNGRTYVTVRTKKNPAGEIRGQIAIAH